MDAKLSQAVCTDERRRAAVLSHPTLNGIDFVEYYENRAATPPEYWLEVVFLKEAPANLIGRPNLFLLEGGVRTVGLQVTGVILGSEPRRLKVMVSEPGDFSFYTLTIAEPDPANPWLDRGLAAVRFSFKAGCPSPFDCRREQECPQAAPAEPVLDYLAKDYASFRRLLLDLIPQRNPGWLERNPADLGMVLVELLAYVGDYLSYYQDAVGTEAYLDTCHHRISAKRHAFLVDYRVHDGRNAWSYVHFEVDSPGEVPQGAKLLTRVVRPLRGQTEPPDTEILHEDLDLDGDPAVADTVVFETATRLKADPGKNQLVIHTWGDRNCCLPQGATSAHLFGLEPTAGGTRQAFRPPLKPGDYLLFEEVKGPATGLAADAEPAHRYVVRLTAVDSENDPVFRETLLHGELTPKTDEGQAFLPLVRVTWDTAEALPSPLCLSTSHPETGLIKEVSVARGNVVPCDHGRTVFEDLPLPAARGGRTGHMELRLPRGPLTFQAMPAEPTFDDKGRLKQERHELKSTPREVRPAVVLILTFPPGETEIWKAVPHLLDSDTLDRHFVVDMDNGGEAVLRFGNGEYGGRPLGAEAIQARYRVGNGRAGNVGRGSLVHMVKPPPEERRDPNKPNDPVPDWPQIRRIRQPLPSVGGVEPESVEEVRLLAPRAFHTEQFRAVTPADYEAAALKLTALSAAKATCRWTGSWHTMFVAVHPRDPKDLRTEPGGRTRLADELMKKVTSHLSRYKLAGCDLEVRTAQYVPLEIYLTICVTPGHFRGEVLEAVSRALSNRQFTDGSVGFFHLSRLSFGRPVYLSQVYAAMEQVAGVESAVVTVFKRYWLLPNQELENGVIPLGDEEIARLDNDPNFPENGVLRLSAIGGL